MAARVKSEAGSCPHLHEWMWKLLQFRMVRELKTQRLMGKILEGPGREPRSL